MPFISRYQEEILTELQSYSQLDLSKIEGSFEWDVLSSNALEFAKMEAELAECYNNAFAHTASNEYLDMHAAHRGIIRKPALKAVGELEITGNGTIREGSLFQTDAGVKFVAVSETKVVGTTVIEIEAVDAGAQGNVAANTIIRIPMSIPGIRSCNNPAKTHDGYDVEDDDTLRERFLFAVRYPAASGNCAQYQQWATSIPGVGTARCIPCYKGRGSVQVVIVDSNFQEASSVLIQEVYNYIYTEMPADVAELSVISAKTIPVNINAKIKGVLNFDAFKTAVLKYFTDLVKETVVTPTLQYGGRAGYVSIAQIGHLIITAGEAVDYDHETLLLNGNAANVNLYVDEIPALGEINFYA